MAIQIDLIKSCIAQDRAAQKQLYLLLLPYLRAVANRYLRDTSYEKDALQESFVAIFKSLSNYDYTKASLKHWAARITINKCINYNKRIIGFPKETFSVDQHDIQIPPEVLNQVSVESMLTLLKQMPKGYFEVFNLSVIDGYSHEEIAALLGISESLSRKHLSRARGWLKKRFVNRTDLILKMNTSSNFLN